MTRLLSSLLFTAAVGAAQPAQQDLELTLFSDFQCYYCAQMARPMRELESKGVDGVRTRIHFKNFPLGFHADAPLAARAAQAVGQQGKFWEMHDLLFANQKALKREDLLGYAERLQLDMARFRKDLDSEKFKALVAEDLAEGQKLGVDGIPSPSAALRDLKAYATRSLNAVDGQAGRIPWTRHGSTRTLADDRAVSAAVACVLTRQGAPIAAYSGAGLRVEKMGG